MFKSVFAKYICAFMLIILFCFSVIIAIVTSIVVNYSVNNKETLVRNAAESASVYFSDRLELTQEKESFRAYVSDNKGDVEDVLTVIASAGEDMTVMLTDKNGSLLIYEGKDKELIGENAVLPSALVQHITLGEHVSETSTLGGIYSSPRMIHAVPIYNENAEICGTVIVCASSVIMTELLSDIVRAVVMSILWVMLAALIAVYVVTERIIAPLKEISVAAHQFASGRFDARVNVRGSDEVAQLATAFNHMAESLDNYETMRNTFISNVSHDLRTPMTSISGFVDGILDGVIPPEKHSYYLGIVSSEVKRLSRLVASLLELSRIQAGERKFNPAPFDVCELARQIIISFEKNIDDKRLEVEFECDRDNMTVNADRDAIYQVVYNLCDNAIKFSREGGLFSLKIKTLKNKKILISVYNEGQGIGEDDLPYVFERFYKSDKSRGLNKTGVGLGLFISKTIVESHGEKIWAESEKDSFCRFSFTLPAE